jgi:hypothetical protein
MARPLFKPKSNPIFHQKPNSSRQTVPLTCINYEYLMCRVGLGVWLKAVLSTSSCFALIVVRGPRLLPSSQFIGFF